MRRGGVELVTGGLVLDDTVASRLERAWPRVEPEIARLLSPGSLMARLDHVNARVGARRSRLIGPAGLRELLVSPTLAARVELLVSRGRSAAAPGLEPPKGAAGAAARGRRPPGDGRLAAVEAALRAGVRADEARLLAEVEGARQRRLLSAALGLQEGQAIKVLLRGTAAGVAPERLVGAGAATRGLPEASGCRAGARAVAGGAGGAARGGGEPLRRAAPRAAAERDRAGLLPAEVAVDRVAYARVGAAARGRGEDVAELVRFLAERADLRNASTLLAMGEAVPATDLFLPGGLRIGAEEFARLAGGGGSARREAAAALVPCAPERLLDPASADRLLERAAARRLARAARRAPLSLAVPLAWIEARREEVRRIAVVLRGCGAGAGGRGDPRAGGGLSGGGARDAAA